MSGSLDLEIARWIAEHRSVPVTRTFHDMEAVGQSPIFYGPVALAGLLVVTRLGPWWGLPRMILAIGIVVVVTGQLKELIDRPRPPVELAASFLSGPAMPSSHASFTSVVVAAALLTPWWTSARLHRIAIVIGVAHCGKPGITSPCGDEAECRGAPPHRPPPVRSDDRRGRRP